MNIVVFGSTDTTKVCVDTLCEIGFAPKLVVFLDKSFNISYSQNGKIKNFRHFNFDGYYDEKDIELKKFVSNEDLIAFLNSAEIGFKPDLAIVAGWYHYVPRSVRALFPRGCVGFHASKLPELRGGAPLNWAILLGLKKTGVSMFELTDGIDDGPLWDQEVFDIENTDQVGDLIVKVNIGIVAMLRRSVPRIARRDLRAVPQSGDPSYSLQRAPEDGAIKWQRSGHSIERLIRAVSKPYPGAYSYFEGRKVIFWRGVSLVGDTKIFGVPGQIFVGSEKEVHIVTGSNALKVLEATFENGDCALPLLQLSNNKRFVKDASINPTV